MAEFFYRSGPNEFGPLTASELKNLAGAGRLAAVDEVRKGRGGKWIRAADVVGLFDRALRQTELAINEMDVMIGIPATELPTPSESVLEADRETALEPPITKEKQVPMRAARVESSRATAINVNRRSLVAIWSGVVCLICYLASALGAAVGVAGLWGAAESAQKLFAAVCFLIALVGLAGGCTLQLLLAQRASSAKS